MYFFLIKNYAVQNRINLYIGTWRKCIVSSILDSAKKDKVYKEKGITKNK